MGYKDFTEMPVWQCKASFRQSFELLVRIYPKDPLDKTTKNYPSDERFGLISDMRRSANSIAHPENFGTEGFGRFSVGSFGEPKDKTRFYAKHPLDKISRGSAYELISQLLVSVALSYINEKAKSLLVESARNIIEELNALIHSLES